ncbi:MAG: FecR family protein [Methylobacter sp.]|jgi:transmembrane sensor|nr:FecR family protein [Methylobacter sp.]
MPSSANEPSIPELKQQAIDWLVRLRSDDLSDGEMYAFADWLSQDHAHSSAFVAAENLFNNMVLAAKSPVPGAEEQAESSQPQKKILANNELQRCQAPSPAGESWDERDKTNNLYHPHPSLLPQGRRSRQLCRYLSSKHYTRWMTASLVLAAAWLFAVILVIPQQSHLFDDYLSDYHTETGELREIQLADGSRLLLNTNTAVSVDFKNSIRQITLYHGQASFTVAKDMQRPFEVVSDGLIVRALGTVFEVYNPDSSEISVTVQEHAVAVRAQTTAEQHFASVSVQEGQQLRYRPGGTLQQPEPVELNQTTAWQQHRLFINDRPLSELIEELDRYRVGRIFLSDEKLKNLRITGIFSLDNPNDVLNSVRKVLALEETRLGPWWVLLHR